VVDVVDIVLVVLVVAFAIHGLRLGALVQLLTFGGFVLGFVLGALLAVAVASGIHESRLRTLVTLFIVFGSAVVFSIGGRILGSWSSATLKRHNLAPIDSALGVAVAAVAVLLSAWMVASLLSQSRFTWISSSIGRSDILKTVDAVLPPVPSVLAHLQSLLANEGFPPVFAQLSPPVVGPVPAPSESDAQRIAATAAASTVKLRGMACGFIQEGTGFAVGHGLVVTNAHVVAGETDPGVVVGQTTYHAVPVLVDPELDVAVLRTDAPLGPPLSLSSSMVGRGTAAAVIGYPEDGPESIAPAGVAASLVAQGRDIYNEGLVTRSVYEIDATVLPGNSGGPLVAPDGSVIGVVFSRSTISSDVGYALASPAVLARVQSAETRTSPVGTGACTSS